MPQSATAAAAVSAAVFGHYGRACTCCGATDDLTIDHVNGGGQAHRVELFGSNRAGSRFWRWLIAQGFPEGYRTMCRRCNRSKGDGAACRLWHGDPAYRRCTGPCGQVLLLIRFGSNATRPDGRQSWCPDCRNHRARRPDFGPRACAWCKGPIPVTARRDAVCCSIRCRQARRRASAQPE
jgi:hypothetical protein